MADERDDWAVPKLTTGTTDEKLVRIDQRLVIIDKRLVIIDKRLEAINQEANLESWRTLGITLTIAGAGFVFSDASSEKTSVLLAGFVMAVFGVAILIWRAARHYVGK